MEFPICAQATPQGAGAIAVIRLSGEGVIDILNTVFKPVSDFDLSSTKTHKLRFGTILNGDEIIDEVLISIFRAPHSYTGEDGAEISCHGSDYIVQDIMRLLISKGIKLAQPGEFTKRAFLNGKLDLAQAEAVADLIASETKAAHDVAMHQMKGGFSNELSKMRGEILDIVSLMELELDFSEEEVEFADRKQLKDLIDKVMKHISKLIDSFTLGNVIKNGVPVAIVGATNTGKSTLLNTLSGEDRAIVSDIDGTTRDTIEEVINIDGIPFRFIDTAGIRNTTETIEIIGIERTFSKMQQASVIIMMLDAQRPENIEKSIHTLSTRLSDTIDQQIIILINKIDCVNDHGKLIKIAEGAATKTGLHSYSILPISAKNGVGVEQLTSLLISSRKSLKNGTNETMVTNLRHFEALKEAKSSLERVIEGLNTTLPTDLLSQDIREALYHIGSITGEIATEEILGNIFRKFCIGK